ncbi:cardiolipin synthase [uncultured Polaribacter sp.]|uniref:cardiolipin synthase n=1 Tax=uncultured Polaribacter sp. TaxID=174711 RepID=UPI002626629D|nr:cardiolipin synthase [uncultured Polaribacter sp.]
MIFYTLFLIHILFFSWAFYNILYFGVKPSKSLSWILITFFFPFIGVLSFIIFGINRRRLKFFELKETKKRKNYIKASFTNKENSQLDGLASVKAKKISTLIYNNTNFPLESNNNVTILKNGKETFNALCDSISKAEKFIHLQYFIIENGKVFNRIKKLLLEKRKENVEVRILYDSFGSYYLNKKSITELKEAGCKIYPETPLKYGTFLFSLNFRNHRKIAVIDNKIGFTGGVNISDEYITKDTNLGIWQDTHVKIEGKSVSHLHKSFIKDYYYATNKDLSKNKKYNIIYKSEGHTKLQIINSGPDYKQAIVMQQYLSFINLAEKSICVLNPYFIPTFSILEAFKIAALSGIKVQLLLPKKGDSKVATYSMYSYFEVLINAGVEIYLREDFSHSKVIYIDDEILSIGSTNFDCRSFEHNYELNAIIFDKEKTKEVKLEFEERLTKATKINLETFKNRSKKQKTLERLCRFFSPLL